MNAEQVAKLTEADVAELTEEEITNLPLPEGEPESAALGKGVTVMSYEEWKKQNPQHVSLTEDEDPDNEAGDYEDTPKKGDASADKVKRVADMLADLSLWEKKAITRVRDNRSASVSFTSADIEPDIAGQLEVGLDACETVEDVRELFRFIRERIGKDEQEAGRLERLKR